jgi:hypothetical protein
LMRRIVKTEKKLIMRSIATPLPDVTCIRLHIHEAQGCEKNNTLIR